VIEALLQREFKYMHKLLVVSLLALCCASLAACGQSGSNSTAQSGPERPTFLPLSDSAGKQPSLALAQTEVLPKPDTEVTPETTPDIFSEPKQEVVPTNRALSPGEVAALNALYAGPNAPQFRILPRLQKFAATPQKSWFQVGAATRIVIVDKTSGLQNTLGLTGGWAEKIRQITGLSIPVVTDVAPRPGDIIIGGPPKPILRTLVSKASYSWKQHKRAVGDEVFSEGYTIDIDAQNVRISYLEHRAALQGLQTLGQMLLLDRRAPGEHLALPQGSGYDYPNFKHRAVLIDVGRQFVPVKDLIGLMEVMSLAKLNILHLHLNDNVDEGRDGIAQANGANGYLRLWDPSLPADLIGMKPKDSPSDDADRAYYTKADIALLEAIAGSYGIEIMPEIDVPGHSRAFVDHRPEFGIPDAKGREKNSLDVRKPEILPFITKAIVEYSKFFKSKKFHVGGDEAYGVPRADWARFMDALERDLPALGVGGENLFHWSEGSGGVDTSANYILYNWSAINYTNLRGRNYVDASTSRYIVPYVNSGGFQGSHPVERGVGSAEVAWNGSGLPIGGALTVWNDMAEAHDYGFEIMNTGLKYMMQSHGYTYWTGILLKPNSTEKIEYVDLPSGFPQAAYEFNATWIQNRFPYFSGQQAVDLVLDSATWRNWRNGQYVSQKAANDPLGYDPVDLKKAFNGPLFLRAGVEFVVDMPGEGKPFATRPETICSDKDFVAKLRETSRCDEDVWNNPIANVAGENSSGGLRKIGPGKLTLNGANTYTGPTTVAEGTLVLTQPMTSQVIVEGTGKYVSPEESSGVTHLN
jgi:autotransporter-associated beta strand protein